MEGFFMGKTINLEDNEGVLQTVAGVINLLQPFTDTNKLEILEIVAKLISVRHAVNHKHNEQTNVPGRKMTEEEFLAMLRRLTGGGEL